MKNLRTALEQVQKLAEIFIGLILGVMILVVASQTFFRYVISASIPWSEELSRFLFVALIALGINLGISRDMMVRIDAIDGRLSETGQKVMGVFREVIGIMMNLFFAYSTFDLISIGARQSSPALGIPMSIMYIILLIGFALAVAASLMRIPDIIRPSEKVGDE